MDWLRPEPGVFDGLRALDGLWLEETLADTTAEVTYQHGLDQTVAAVDAATPLPPSSSGRSGRGDPAHRKDPRQGLLMPPKSTYFTPKLRTGLVIRDLSTG